MTSAMLSIAQCTDFSRTVPVDVSRSSQPSRVGDALACVPMPRKQWRAVPRFHSPQDLSVTNVPVLAQVRSTMSHHSQWLVVVTVSAELHLTREYCRSRKVATSTELSFHWSVTILGTCTAGLDSWGHCSALMDADVSKESRMPCALMLVC